MSIEDWLPDGDPEFDVDEAREVRCKFCGTRGLFWELRTGSRYVLVDEDGAAHSPFCKGRTAEANEFKKLED